MKNPLKKTIPEAHNPPFLWSLRNNAVCERYSSCTLCARPAQVVRQGRHLPDHFSGLTPKKNLGNNGFHKMWFMQITCINMIELKSSITRSIEEKNRFVSHSGKTIANAIFTRLSRSAILRAGDVIYVLHNGLSQCHSLNLVEGRLVIKQRRTKRIDRWQDFEVEFFTKMDELALD